MIEAKEAMIITIGEARALVKAIDLNWAKDLSTQDWYTYLAGLNLLAPYRRLKYWTRMVDGRFDELDEP